MKDCNVEIIRKDKDLIMEYEEVVNSPKKESDPGSSPHHPNSNCHGNSGATTKEVMEAVAVKSAEHGHLTHAESNEFTSTRNQEDCPEVKVTSQGEETSMKDVKDCPEYPGIIINALPPVVFNDDNLKPSTLVEELVVYTEEMALFHRHEISSPRYSFNVPTQNQLVKDNEVLEADDVFIDEDRNTGYNPAGENRFKESEGMKVDVESCVMHSSQGGLLAMCDFNSVPVAPWASSNEPIVSGKDMLAIPRLSDLYDTEGDGILGVVMQEDRGHEVEVDNYRWGYSHQSYDPGYGTPLRMIDYYDTVDSGPSPSGVGADEEGKKEDKAVHLGISAKVRATDDNNDGNDDIGDGIEHHGNGDDHVVYHEATAGDGVPFRYHVSDGDQSPKYVDSVFVNSDTVKYIDNQITGRARRLSSYDNTFTPDDRMPMEGENIYLLENVSLKDILEEPREIIPGKASQDPSNELLPLSNILLTDGNASNNALTPDNLMTTTSSGDTSPAVRECTVGYRVTSKDSLAGLAPDWEESRSISDDAGDQLEKLALSNISSACGQAPVIKESEATAKTNVSLVSKLKKELSKGLLPSLPPASLRGSEKTENDEEKSKNGQQVVGEQETEHEVEQLPEQAAQEQQQQNKDNVVIDTKDTTQHELGGGEFQLQSEQEFLMIEEVDQSGDNKQVFILEHNDGKEIEDNTWLDHCQNKIIIERNDKFEFKQVCEFHGSNDNLRNKTDNLGLGKYMDSDIHCTGAVQKMTHEEIHEEILDVHEGVFDVNEVALDRKDMNNDVQEETLDTPDIVVTQEKENSLEKDKDTERAAEVNLKVLATSDDRLDVQSKDKSSNSSDTTKSFLENSFNEDVDFNSEQAHEGGVGNAEETRENIFSNEISSLKHCGFSMKRTSSFSETDLRESQDDRGEEEMTEKNNWSEVNQPKPPPKGSSRRCVNAR